jgi:hypothetical protein
MRNVARGHGTARRVIGRPQRGHRHPSTANTRHDSSGTWQPDRVSPCSTALAAAMGTQAELEHPPAAMAVRVGVAEKVAALIRKHRRKNAGLPDGLASLLGCKRDQEEAVALALAPKGRGRRR